MAYNRAKLQKMRYKLQPFLTKYNALYAIETKLKGLL